MKGKVSLADVLYEYLGQPQTAQETQERVREQLSDKERELVRELFANKPPSLGRIKF